ncbi:MAG: tetratricopeptide repeat protein [Candidatus Acidiferrum sp.]
MRKRARKYLLILAAGTGLLLPAFAYAGKPPQVPIAVSPSSGSPDPTSILNGVEMNYLSGNAEIHVVGPNGVPIAQPVVVTLLRTGGQLYGRETTKAGFVKFERVPYSEFTIQIVTAGYQPATKSFEVSGPGAVSVTVNLQPMEAEEAAASVGFYALSPRTQRDVGKAMEALRAKKPNDARKHLEAAYKAAPKSAEVEYLFGVYASQTNDPVRAQSYWTKTLELDPKHLNALLAIGQDLLHENKSADAERYLERAVETAPSSWRAQALLSEALVIEGKPDEAIKHAQKAIELGHDRAASAQLVLARAMLVKGNKDQAIPILVSYVQGHPADKETAKYLDRLEHPQPGDAPGDAASSAREMAAITSAATALPVPSNWLPPDVDESVPPVDAGSTCNVDDVVRKAGKQIMVLVSDVDRFAATETLTHESIDKYGMASAPEKRKFNYVASIQEVQQGFLNVEEYRSTASGGPAEFPGGVATNGLPALVLIFHPHNAVDFAMTCEGLAQLSSGPAWQIHFKQRPDKPNVIKRYRIGADGPSYPVALKGRAWVSADNYQIVKLETDLVAPVPQIKLVADRTDIEYGPVKFAKGNVSMWLPQSADVYYDWMGRRIHRRHSFSNFMLFAVDDKQKISTPKVDPAPSDDGPGDATKQNQ